MAVAKRLEFTPVNRISKPCACCGRDRGPRAVRGVRVYDRADTLTQYYCDHCIDHLAKAKSHP